MKRIWPVVALAAILAFSALPATAGTGLKRLQQRVAALESTVPDIYGAVADIDALQSQVQSLSSQLSVMTNRVNDLEDELAFGGQDALGDLEDRVSGLEISIYDCLYAQGISQFGDYVWQDFFGDFWLGTIIDFDDASPHMWAMGVYADCLASSKSGAHARTFDIKAGAVKPKVRARD